MINEPNLPVRRNPCCGYCVDAAETLESVLGEQPNPWPRTGDLTLCLNCGAILVFIDPITNQTRLALPKDGQTLSGKRRRMLVRAQKYIRRRGWIPRERERLS